MDINLANVNMLSDYHSINDDFKNQVVDFIFTTMIKYQLVLIDQQSNKVITSDNLNKILVLIQNNGFKIDAIDSQRLDDNLSYYQKNNSTNDINVKELLLLLLSSQTDNTLADKIFSGINDSIVDAEKGRNDIRDKLYSLAAELKIFAIIQALINKVMASNDQFINIGDQGINLLSASTYGYSQEEFLKSPEYKLLTEMFPNQDPISIKDFLQSDKKNSPPMPNLNDEYHYDKDNNKLGNLAAMINDCSRPLSDMVNEQSTNLNESNSKYQSAMEALSRFIQKFDTLLRDIINAF